MSLVAADPVHVPLEEPGGSDLESDLLPETPHARSYALCKTRRRNTAPALVFLGLDFEASAVAPFHPLPDAWPGAMGTGVWPIGWRAPIPVRHWVFTICAKPPNGSLHRVTDRHLFGDKLRDTIVPLHGIAANNGFGEVEG